MKILKKIFAKKESKLEPVGSLLKSTWSDYKKQAFKFIELLVYGLIGSLPFMLLLFIFIRVLMVGGETWPGFGVLGIFIVFFLGSLVLMIVWNLRAQIGGILLLKENYQLSPRESFKRADKYMGPFIGVTALLSVLIFAWGLLFLLPALIFGIYYGFSQYVQVAEDERPFRSVERSYDLVRGHWWSVFGRFLLLILVGFLAYGALSIPFFWISEGGWLFEAYNLLINLIWIILSPFFTIYPYKVYRNLVRIKG